MTKVTKIAGSLILVLLAIALLTHNPEDPFPAVEAELRQAVYTGAKVEFVERYLKSAGYEFSRTDKGTKLLALRRRVQKGWIASGSAQVEISITGDAVTSVEFRRVYTGL